jgi:hypothetical protein
MALVEDVFQQISGAERTSVFNLFLLRSMQATIGPPIMTDTLAPPILDEQRLHKAAAR